MCLSSPVFAVFAEFVLLVLLVISTVEKLVALLRCVRVWVWGCVPHRQCVSGVSPGQRGLMWVRSVWTFWERAEWWEVAFPWFSSEILLKKKIKKSQCFLRWNAAKLRVENVRFKQWQWLLLNRSVEMLHLFLLKIHPAELESHSSLGVKLVKLQPELFLVFLN